MLIEQTTEFQLKGSDSKRVLGFNCKKRIEQLNFFDWL